MEITQAPALPPENEWRFVDELQAPLWSDLDWPPRPTQPGEASLGEGVRIDARFPDPQGRLETVYSDLNRFLAAAGVREGGDFVIRTAFAAGQDAEAYVVEVGDGLCTVRAGDTEGIRRAIFHLEDEMCRRRGPYLPIGRIERRALIRTRISRCFFGPIKRPPRNRDELTDEVDYYPDEYLNRLAHEGINALWLTAHFRDLCPSRFFPDHGRDRERRLAKLRRTVTQCARYGIKIYVFTIEPMGFGTDPTHLLPQESLEANPGFAGHRRGPLTYFCTSTDEGLEYLRECTRFLFSAVPGLGGLIDINLGERPTHCYSALDSFRNCTCPRCSKREPWEVFRDTVSALAEGMHDAEPDAEMVSWLYVPQPTSLSGASIEETESRLREIAAHMPSTVTFQYNFESGGLAEQLGRQRMALDYFLSWAGPSHIFRNCASRAVAAGARASAKVQVGCSHEVATIPFIPVPGLLFEKYRAMHEIGVTTVMQCWYFGNYPGLMNKAAGELSFAPFTPDRSQFLHRLARIDWGDDAPRVVEAWELFHEGYANFPINLTFTHYGPLHHAVVWPLHLVPVDQPIAPSWKFTFPLESGDRIGECICYDHTLEEVLVLLDRMSELWNRGVEILVGLEHRHAANRQRVLDIGLVKALGLQIHSARNVFRFYALREQLPYQGKEEALASLEAMGVLVREEMANSEALRGLCEKDSRLGFHSEAEGYKYFPAKLDWRIGLLEELLAGDFPAVREQIESGASLFPAYTGVQPEGRAYLCAGRRKDAAWEPVDHVSQTSWRAWEEREGIVVQVRCCAAEGATGEGECVTVELEPCRLWPAMLFTIRRDGSARLDRKCAFRDDRWHAAVADEGEGWQATLTATWELLEGFHQDRQHMRLNLGRRIPGVGDVLWVARNPLPHRLHFGTANPKDMGWLLLGPRQ